MQKVNLWQISESSQIMKKVCEERELLTKAFFSLSNKGLEVKAIDLRAVSALLVAGIFYLVLHAKSTDMLFCEIDLKTSDGMDRTKNEIDLTLSNSITKNNERYNFNN